MKTDAKVPQTNFGRESKKKFFLWMNLLDALICLVLILVAVIIISLIKLNIFAILGIIFNLIYLMTIISFRKLNKRKFQVLEEICKKNKYQNPYSMEHKNKKYISFTTLEFFIPITFIIILVIFIWLLYTLI